MKTDQQQQKATDHLVILDDQTTGTLSVRVASTNRFTDVTEAEVQQLSQQATTVHRCVFEDFSASPVSQSTSNS